MVRSVSISARIIRITTASFCLKQELFWENGMGVALKSNIFKFKSPHPPFTKVGLGEIKGMTLVEVLIALVVLLLVSLAMLHTALFSIENNMINVLRDEAVSVAEMRMNEARNIPFDTLVAAAGADVQVVTRPVRNIPAFAFTATRTVRVRDGNNLQIEILVEWEWKEKTVANGDPYRHNISTLLRRP